VEWDIVYPIFFGTSNHYEGRMRVEHCGDLLLEPSSLHQQPSTISSHCSNHHQSSRNIQFSELNQIEVPLIGSKLEYILNNNNNGGQRGVFGFTLSEEEWSLFNKSHLGKSDNP